MSSVGKTAMKSFKILMLAPSCFSAGGAESFVNANLVSTMRNAGWSLDVVTTADRAYHWYPESGTLWRDVAACSHIIEERPRTFYGKLLSSLEYGLLSGQVMGGGRWAVPGARRALQLAATRRYDVILSRAMPAAAHQAAFIVAGKTGIPWIANWNDPIPDSMYPPPYVGGNGTRTRMGFWESRYYRAMTQRAVWHTFPCERLRSYICGYLPGNIMERSSAVPHISLMRREKINGRHQSFILLHAGSLRHPRDPSVFLHGVKLFYERLRPEKHFKVRFIVDRPDEVINAAKEYGIEPLVQVEPIRSYAEMPLALADAAVLVIIEAKLKEGIFFPSKFADYVRTGRPILAVSPKVGTLSDILSQHGGGLAVDCARPDEVAIGIATLYKSWRAGTLDENYASDRLIRLFDKDVILTRYIEIFGRLGIRGS